MLVDREPGIFLTNQQLDGYVDFLREAGAVKYFKTARERLLSAELVTLTKGQDLVGIGAIKAKRSEYNRKIATRSQYLLPERMCEIGYIAVAKAYRGKGYSKQIVKELLEYDDWVFATTSSEAMRRTFCHFGFKPKGNMWTSKEGAKLSLWVKE